MLKNNYRSRLIAVLLLLLLVLTACEHKKFRNGEQLYARGRYAAAIEQLDLFIHAGKNGAYVTRAELVRSSCYLELGLAAADKENWNLAIRLFKLANSDPADLELAKVYYTLAQQATEANDIPKAQSYYSLILNETTGSELVPEVMQQRIRLFLDYFTDKSSAWSEYMQLYDLFPENEFEISARQYVNRFIAINIDEAVNKAVNKEYDAALEDLFQIRRYPVGNQDRIDLEISNIYQELAENEIQNKNYYEANQMFLKALQYYPNKKEAINKRLEMIAYLYVEKGNDYLRVRDFENAISFYRKSFEIIPDFDKAVAAINNANTIQNNIKTAADLAVEAQLQEMNRNYTEARNLYTRAHQLDNQTDYANRAWMMGNLIEAESNPVSFAKSIIINYQNGILGKKIMAQKQQILKTFKQEEIRDTGWKILLSTGQYKYEARYDLITPSESLFYVWQVNLRDRSITPLNKISDKLMQ